jgi:hypothetical protein
MYDYSLEDAIEVLRNEQERRQVMEIIRKMREIGGEDTILKLAGCILMAPSKKGVA